VVLTNARLPVSKWSRSHGGTGPAAGSSRASRSDRSIRRRAAATMSENGLYVRLRRRPHHAGPLYGHSAANRPGTARAKEQSGNPCRQVVSLLRLIAASLPLAPEAIAARRWGPPLPLGTSPDWDWVYIKFRPNGRFAPRPLVIALDYKAQSSSATSPSACRVRRAGRGHPRRLHAARRLRCIGAPAQGAR
jgi:hypothetical protein